MLSILLINFLLTFLFFFLNHPMTMGLVLLLQTIMISLITGLLHMNFWFSYILFLIMVGGMLVLFIYMTSVASNEKFKFSMNISYLMMLMFLMIFLMFFNNFFISFNNIFIDSIMINMNYKMSLSKFLNFPSSIILFLMIIYLFITLVAVVKITSFNLGPLRQKF